ncbi:zinc finger protein 469-like [Mobula hypostoma]|uniref:zinc finger protein 469-like n=1 Tax=Mobula hypostoma TaxID=723540 RepID=UPI002FC2B43D
MMGPGLCSLLLSFCLALSSLQPAKSKPLSPMPEPASLTRHRREALPYEAGMFAYPPSEAMPPALGPGERQQLERLALGLALGPEPLEQALRRLAEEERRRREEEREAAYLSRLLRAWRDLGLAEDYPAEGRPRGGYRDYEEPAARGPVYVPGRGRGEEADEEQGGGEEEEAMRYVLGRLLAEVEAAGGSGGARRVRRSSELSPAAPNLLRVKRLGEEEGPGGQVPGDGPMGRPRGRGSLSGMGAAAAIPRDRRYLPDVSFLPE